jgi:hypothetical protein
MEILHPANIDLFQLLDIELHKEITDLLSTDNKVVQLSSATMEDLFIAAFFKYKNQLRINGSSPLNLYFGITKILNETDDEQWIPIFETEIVLAKDPYKNGVWVIKRRGEVKITKALEEKLNRKNSKLESPGISRIKDLLESNKSMLISSFLEETTENLSLNTSSIPSIEILSSANHNDFYLTAILASQQNEVISKTAQKDIKDSLNKFHRTPKKHSIRKDLEIGYPFMDSEQKTVSKRLEDRKLALVEYSQYAEITPIINQLIIQGLEQGKQILVLTDRSAYARKLFNELPINQKVLLPNNWKSDEATRRILNNSIAKAQISKKSNSKHYLLQKQKSNRSAQKLEQYSNAFSSPIFGDKKWVELIGIFLEHQNNTDKSVLSAQLNSTNFEFSFSEYNKLSEKVKTTWPLYESVSNDPKVFFEYNEVWFSKTGKQQTKKQFIEFGQKIQSLTGKTQKSLQNLIDSYAEVYRDELDKTYLDLSKKIKEQKALFQDLETIYGEALYEQKLNSSGLNPFVSRQTKSLQKDVKQLERNWKVLGEYLKSSDYCDFKILEIDDLKSVKSLNIELQQLSESVESWRTNSFNLIQEELKRFSKKHHLNNDLINQMIPETESLISDFFTELKKLGFYNNPPKDYLLTYPKRLKQFNQLYTDNENFLKVLENFEPLYEWTRNWHLSSPEEKELIQALIESKTNNWESAFNSWYLNKFIERNLSEEKTLTSEDVQQALEQIFNFYPQVLEEIEKIWYNKLSKEYYTLSKKDKKLLEEPISENTITTNFNKSHSTLFQQAFPLCFSSNLDSWKALNNELNFDRIIVIESSNIKANITSSLCNCSESMIVFSQMTPNDPDSISYYLDQMPLVRKLSLNGKYYDTCIKLSHDIPNVVNRSFTRKIDLHCTQGVFDIQSQTNEKEADTVIHLLNTIEIDKQSRIYTKTGILCFSEAQRNLIWSYVKELSKRNDDTGEKVRQLERNGLQIGCLNDLLGMQFERLIVSATFSYLDNEALFINPFEFVEPKAFLLGLDWCKYAKAKHIDIVYSSYPEDGKIGLTHNPGALLLINFLKDFKELKENIDLGGSYYFKDFLEEKEYTNPLALRIQNLLRQFYPINQLRLDYELFGIEFPLAILPEDLETKPSVLVFDKIISEEKIVSIAWDHYFLAKLLEEGFNVIHINTIDFWKKPEKSLNLLMDELKVRENLNMLTDQVDLE